MLKLLKSKELPDAVFSASACGAMGALQIRKEKNISVPGEVAFSNEPFTWFTEPDLTTVDQHPMRMGNAAVEIFVEEVKSTKEKFIPQKIVLKPELIIRGSSLRKM